MPPAKKSPVPDPLAPHILALLGEVADKFEPNNSPARQWIARRSQNPDLLDRLQDATLVALRVHDAIGRLEPVNGATIAKGTGTPKGTVSKIARRLIADGLVQSEALPNNKKEVLFRLTPLGRELFTIHRAFDQQMERGLIKFLERYHPDELLFVVRLLTDVLAADFLALGEQAPAPAARPKR